MFFRFILHRYWSYTEVYYIMYYKHQVTVLDFFKKTSSFCDFKSKSSFSSLKLSAVLGNVCYSSFLIWSILGVFVIHIFRINFVLNFALLDIFLNIKYMLFGFVYNQKYFVWYFLISVTIKEVHLRYVVFHCLHQWSCHKIVIPPKINNFRKRNLYFKWYIIPLL